MGYVINPVLVTGHSENCFLQCCHTQPDCYVLCSLHHHAQFLDVLDIQNFPLHSFRTALSPADPCCTLASKTFHVARSGISGGLTNQRVGRLLHDSHAVESAPMHSCKKGWRGYTKLRKRTEIYQYRLVDLL